MRQFFACIHSLIDYIKLFLVYILVLFYFCILIFSIVPGFFFLLFCFFTYWEESNVEISHEVKSESEPYFPEKGLKKMRLILYIFPPLLIMLNFLFRLIFGFF